MDVFMDFITNMNAAIRYAQTLDEEVQNKGNLSSSEEAQNKDDLSSSEEAQNKDDLSSSEETENADRSVSETAQSACDVKKETE